MTTFADGLYQWGGVPVGVNPMYNKIFALAPKYPQGRAWFVNPARGSNGNGRSPAGAFTTMAQAFAECGSGDIIYAIGNIQEQLVTPVQVFDVTVVGCGNRPRNADSSPEGGQYSAVTWRAPASGGTAAQATVRVLQQGWTFCNILFNMIDTNAAGIEIVRNSGAGDLERDASHTSVIGCKFAGAGVGIRSGATSFAENTTNCLILGNTFLSCTYGLRQTAGFGGLNWQIVENMFISNTNDIVGPFTASKILRNSFSLAPTGALILTGTGLNMVHGNYMPGTYAAGTLYAPGTSDNWNGNFASTGVTAAVPS